MSKKIKLCFIGGDKRQRYAAERLSNFADVYGCGDCFIGSERVKYTDNAVNVIHRAHAVILPLPASKADAIIPFSKLAEYASANGIYVLGGLISDYMKDVMSSLEIKFDDYFLDESLTVKNAYLTAEGAVALAMDALETDIPSARIAVLGCGRIGNALCELLRGLYASPTVYARREEVRTLAECRGIKAQTLDGDAEYDCDIIFNTVPERVISPDRLLSMPKSTVLVELASAPGGFDADIAEGCGIKVIKAPGLPGKYAPITAGEAVAKSLLKLLNREGLL